MQTRIAVYGATGYTGKQVARELLRRGRSVLLAGRNAEKLRALAEELGGDVAVQAAALDDPSAVSAVADGAGAVINCAGPFSATTRPLAEAAIRARAHYLDVSGEQRSARWLFEEADAAARDAGVMLLPAFAFFSAPSDMLASLTASGFGPVDDVTVGHAITGWRPSAATMRSRFEGLRAGSLAYERGLLHTVHDWPATTWFDFPASIGRQRVTTYPTPDVVMLPRHIRTKRVTLHATASAFAPPLVVPWLRPLANLASRLLETPLRRVVEAGLGVLWGANDENAMTSDPTRFHVVVRVTGPAGMRASLLSGHAIYDLSAQMVALAATRAIASRGEQAGALTPAQAFEPRELLDRLAVHGVRYMVGRQTTEPTQRASVPEHALPEYA